MSRDCLPIFIVLAFNSNSVNDTTKILRILETLFLTFSFRSFSSRHLFAFALAFLALIASVCVCVAFCFAKITVAFDSLLIIKLLTFFESYFVLSFSPGFLCLHYLKFNSLVCLFRFSLYFSLFSGLLLNLVCLNHPKYCVIYLCSGVNLDKQISYPFRLFVRVPLDSIYNPFSSYFPIMYFCYIFK